MNAKHSAASRSEHLGAAWIQPSWRTALHRRGRGVRNFDGDGAVEYSGMRPTQAASQATRASQRLAARYLQKAAALRAAGVTVYVLLAHEPTRIMRAMPNLTFD